MKTIPQICLIVATMLASAGYSSAAFIYDWSTATASSDPGTLIHNNDNWEVTAGSTSLGHVRNDSAPTGISGNYFLVASTDQPQVTRENDSNFSYAILPEATEVTLSMVINLSSTTTLSWMGLADSSVGGGKFRIGFYNGNWVYRGNDQVIHSLADTGVSAVGSAAKSYRVTTVINKLANTLDYTVENLTDGGSVQLANNVAIVDVDWSAYDALYVRSKEDAKIGSFSINSSIPEPTTVDIIFVGGQSNATVDWANGIHSTLQARGTFSNLRMVHEYHPGNWLRNWYDDDGTAENFDADFYNAGNTGALETAWQDVLDSGNQPRLAGFFWFQGEGDTGSLDSQATYVARFNQMLSLLQTRFGQVAPPNFAVAIIDANQDSAYDDDLVAIGRTDEMVESMRAKLVELGAQANGVAVDTRGAQRVDLWHLTASEKERVGDEMAQAFLLASTEDGTVVDYHFDGDYLDASGSNNHGVSSGNATITTQADQVAVGAGALLLDGADSSYVDLSTPLVFSSAQPWTSMFWARRDHLGDTASMIMGDRDTYSDYIWLAESSSSLRFRSSDLTVYNFPVPQDTEFHHYALVADGAGNLELFCDGLFVASETGDTSFRITSIGRAYPTSGYVFDGSIDEVHIFNQVLSSNQIYDIYADEFKPLSITASDNAFVKGDNTQQDESEVLVAKFSGSTDFLGYSYLRFDISDQLPLKSAFSATVNLHVVNPGVLDGGSVVYTLYALNDVAATSNPMAGEATWDADMTWNIRPDGTATYPGNVYGTAVATMSNTASDRLVRFHISADTLSDLVAADSNSELTFLITSTANQMQTTFASLNNSSGYPRPTLTLTAKNAPVPVGIYNEDDILGLRFTPESGLSYMIETSSDLSAWSHKVSVRGEGQSDWPLPDSDLSQSKRFYRIDTVQAQSVESLDGWSAFKSSEEGGRYVIGLIGDSFTHARTRYSKPLKERLAEEFGNLGAGYIGFSYINSVNGAWSKNGSIDESELDFTIDITEWDPTYGNGYGADSCHITSLGDTPIVTVHVLRSVDEVKLFYATEPVSKSFQYRIAGGSWQSVSVNGSVGLGVELVDVQAFVAPYDIEIQALDAGVSLLGAEAIQSGDGVVVHKLGATGGRATNFANNAVAQAAMQELELDMAFIIFGTNEQGANTSPSSFKASIQNVIDTLRATNPAMEVVIMLPCYTKYETEIPKAYNLQDYGDVFRELAAENNGCFMDFTEVFGPAAELQNLIDAGLMSDDRVHPTTGENSGGELISESILKSILVID